MKGLSTKAKIVLNGVVRIGWQVKRQRGSHRTLSRRGWPDYVFAFHDGVEIGPVVMKKIGERTGLKPEDL